MGEPLVDASPRCTHSECDRAATSAVKLHVPAKGYDPRAHGPIKLLIDLLVCDRHLPDASALLKESPDIVSLLTQVTTHRKLPDPYFEGAWITRVHLASPEYRNWKRRKQAARPTHRDATTPAGVGATP